MPARPDDRDSPARPPRTDVRHAVLLAAALLLAAAVTGGVLIQREHRRQETAALKAMLAAEISARDQERATRAAKPAGMGD